MSQIRKRKTFSLRLTKLELVHLRDLFSVALPPDMKTTVSQALASSEERSLIEARLWKTIVDTCKEAELPLDDEAPDFVVAASTAPAVSVFRLMSEPDEVAEPDDAGDDSEGTSLFEGRGEEE